MIEPAIPADESRRLAALHRTQLLDTPLEERFERITRLLCRLLGVPTASISLVDETRQWFKSIQGCTLSETPRSISFCGHAILSDEVLLVPDARLDPRFHDNPLVTGSEKIVFYAGHPLRAADGSSIGVLCAIDHKTRDFSADDLEVLCDLAKLAEVELNATTMADSHRELLSQLDAERRRALTDPLTRLWNREGIMEILSREHARALRNNEPLGLLMADVDHFKRINDTHGHLAGDAVLREVAKRLLASVRVFDGVGRIGGDEFLLVLPAMPRSGSIESIASRICERMDETMVATPAGNWPVTISVGGAEETVDFACSAVELIKKADDALYRAKQRGRNRSEIIGSATLEPLGV